MRKILTVPLFCLALLIPGIAPAKNPHNQPVSECAILIEGGLIYADYPFNVKLVRVPGYPGSWHAPDVTIKVTYFGAAPDEEYHVKKQKFNVTYVEATFYGSQLVTAGADVKIDATVLETVVKGKKTSDRETTCTLNTQVM